MTRPLKYINPGRKTSPPLTYPEVVECINKMIESGQDVTIKSVFSQIGHGSLSTISKFINQWECESRKQLGADKMPNDKLEGESMRYMISSNFLPANGKKLCTIVINALHMQIDSEEAKRIIDKFDSNSLDKLNGEFVLTMKLADSIMFTSAPDFTGRLIGDLKKALGDAK